MAKRKSRKPKKVAVELTQDELLSIIKALEEAIIGEYWSIEAKREWIKLHDKMEGLRDKEFPKPKPLYGEGGGATVVGGSGGGTWSTTAMDTAYK